jgi:hypothetical protein
VGSSQLQALQTELINITIGSLKPKHNNVKIWHETCFVNSYMFLQVIAYYFAYRDIVAGIVSLVKKLKIKRIVVGSRLELDIYTHSQYHLDMYSSM